MIYVYKDRIVNIEWTVLKGTSNVKENFDRALVKMFLIGPHEKYVLNANAVDGVVSAEVPQELPEGVYSVEIIYIKNWLGVDRAPDRPRRFPVDCRGNDRCIMRTRKDNLFGITEYESEATNVGEGEVVVRVKTSTASYGYDGLSAYEIAVMRGDFEGTEGEWLEWTHERIVTDVRDLLDKMKSRDTRFVVRTKEQRDSLKDLREGDEVYVIDDGMSYVLRMEDGQRVWHAQDYGSVTAKYMLSMIADLPNFVADRAVADEFGKRIVDEYLTRDAVRRYMSEVFKDLFIENPPTIMDGMITVDMLSDAVKQLIGFGPIVNFPDDEFLTTKNGRITLKDRNYDPNNYSGMGRKVLRKNMVNGVNVLTQRMMSCPNTVYVIMYDFDLRGEEIMVPEGCVLEFEGGSLRNGIFVLRNTIINGNFNCLNPNNLIIKGRLNGDFHSKWFGITTNTDIGNKLNQTLNNSIKTDITTESDYAGGYHRESFILDNGIYYTSVSINIGGLFIGLDFDNSTIIPTSVFPDNEFIFTTGVVETFPEGFNGGYFKNLVIRGNNTKAKGINIHRTFGCQIQNIQCRLMKNTGIHIGHNSPEIALENIYIYADTTTDYKSLENVYGLECVSWSDSWLDKLIIGYYPKAMLVDRCGNNSFKDIHVWGRQDREDKNGCLRIGIEVNKSQTIQFINTIVDTVIKLDNTVNIEDIVNTCINGGCGIWLNNSNTLTFNKISTSYAGSSETMYTGYKTVFFKVHGYSNTFYDVRRFPYQENAFGWAEDIVAYPQNCTMIGCDSINGFNQRLIINSNYDENPITTLISSYKGNNVDLLTHIKNNNELGISNGARTIYFRENSIQPANKGTSKFSQTTLGTPKLPWMAAYLRRLSLQQLNRDDSLYWAEKGSLMYREDLNKIVMRATDGTTEADLVDINGQSLNKSGTTNQRPSTYIDIGFQYFDTTLNKYICWNGTDWINLDGTNLS